MSGAHLPDEKIQVINDGRGARSLGYDLAPYDAVYISIPKVACTSLKTAFASVLGLGGDVHYEAKWRSVPLTDLEAGHEGVFVFAFVRNPWDRLLSCFTSKIEAGRDDYYFTNGVEHNFWTYGGLFSGDMSFADFVDATASIPDDDGNIHFTSQHRHLVGANGVIFVDFVGRFESIAADFAAVGEQIGLNDIELPHLYQTAHGHYSGYYSARTRRVVESRWAVDIERFGYAFEGQS